MEVIHSFKHELLNNALRVSKILDGEISGVKIIIGECSYRIGKGTNDFPFFIFINNNFLFPKILIETESYLDKILSKIDIDFSSHPEFSKKFRLHGSDEYEIKKMLNEDFLSSYQEFSFTQCMETSDDKVIFFDYSETHDPVNIPEKLKLYSKLIRLMEK